ncbi:helix-turn-helix domain-containing protein [Pedobacter sp. JCM 36344]|uniref:helix-turn-helix domain-containing protein n=1 Tax=Pedobacter sp. JCM 36344 TaxID=3374280 RepID=UPI00397C2F56
MSIILGIETLIDNLDSDKLEQLDKAAAILKSQSNIEFRILSVDETNISIETAQSETRSGKYANQATLVKRTLEIFEKILSGFNIDVEPVPYLPTPTSVVNPAWLNKKMKEKGVRIKQIAFETGVDRESISDWITGKRAMSQIVKAMFYFYLS